MFFFLRKYINAELIVKTRLVAKGFKENNSDILSDSPTFSRGSMSLTLNVIALFNCF